MRSLIFAIFILPLTAFAETADLSVGATPVSAAPVAEAASTSPNFAWLASVKDRALSLNQGSSAVLTRSAEGEPLIVSASHVLAIYMPKHSADEARARLASTPDESERNTPFDPEAEIMIDAQDLSGMSGGPMFDGRGHMIAINNRSCAPCAPGKAFVRGVRVAYVLKNFNRARSGLSTSDQQSLRAWLDPRLDLAVPACTPANR